MALGPRLVLAGMDQIRPTEGDGAAGAQGCEILLSRGRDGGATWAGR
jgi:hypothetical protein